MIKVIAFPKSRFVDLFVNPTLSKPLRKYRCDDVRARVYRECGHGFTGISGLDDSLILRPTGYRLECKSHAHAVRLVKAITMTIAADEARALIKGAKFEGFQTKKYEKRA